MTRVEFLTIAHNFVRELPPCIGQLRLLKTFLCDDNFLCDLPEEIEEMFCLSYINIASNQVPPPFLHLVCRLWLLPFAVCANVAARCSERRP